MSYIYNKTSKIKVYEGKIGEMADKMVYLIKENTDLDVSKSNQTKASSIILSALLYSHKNNAWISYDKTRNNFNKWIHETNLKEIHKPFTDIMDKLISLNYVAWQKGHPKYNDLSAKLSRFMPTIKFYNDFIVPFDESKHVNVNYRLPLVKRKLIDDKQRGVKYDINNESRSIKRMYDQVTKINSSFVGLHLQYIPQDLFCPGWFSLLHHPSFFFLPCYYQMEEPKPVKCCYIKELEPKKLADFSVLAEPETLSKSQMFYSRIFSNDTWKDGGRFYNKITYMTKIERATIKVDGKQTIERDFQGMGLKVLYARRLNINYNTDPYEIKGIERKVVKKVIQVMIDSESHENAAMSLYDNREGKAVATNKKAATALIQAVEHKHRDVKHLFYKKTNAYFIQKWESRIAADIMGKFAKLGKFCAGIHDSFIVAEEDELLLRETMHEMYEKHLGFSPVVK